MEEPNCMHHMCVRVCVYSMNVCLSIVLSLRKDLSSLSREAALLRSVLSRRSVCEKWETPPPTRTVCVCVFDHFQDVITGLTEELRRGFNCFTTSLFFFVCRWLLFLKIEGKSSRGSKSISQHFQNDIICDAGFDWLAWLGIPAQMPAIGPRAGYGEGQPFTKGWIYIPFLTIEVIQKATANSRSASAFDCPASVRQCRGTWEKRQQTGGVVGGG